MINEYINCRHFLFISKMLNEPSLSLLASTVNTIDRSEIPARPMTAMSTITKRSKCLMAITEGRGIAIEIGICLFDMNSCECTLSQVRHRMYTHNQHGVNSKG